MDRDEETVNNEKERERLVYIKKTYNEKTKKNWTGLTEPSFRLSAQGFILIHFSIKDTAATSSPENDTSAKHAAI